MTDSPEDRDVAPGQPGPADQTGLPSPKKRPRRRRSGSRRGRKKDGEGLSPAEMSGEPTGFEDMFGDPLAYPEEPRSATPGGSVSQAAGEAAGETSGETPAKKSRSGRKRGSRGKRGKAQTEGAAAQGVEAAEPAAPAEPVDADMADGTAPEAASEAAPATGDAKPESKAKPKRSRRSKREKPKKDEARARRPADEEMEDFAFDEDDDGLSSDGAALSSALLSEEEAEIEAAASAKAAQVKPKKRKMFVSVLPGEQIEVAVTEDGKIREYYVEMLHQAKTKGNVYKGRINNIDAALQAAFVSYGAEKNGFLQIDEVHPSCYQMGPDAKWNGKYPPIQQALRPGQEVLVQIGKEPTGSKGAFLTTYLSIPGRYFVLTPGNPQLGVSRKIENDEERKRLKDIVDKMNLGEDMGVIVRTVSQDQPATALARDLEFIRTVWEEIQVRQKGAPVPSLVYQEKELAARAVRDYLTQEVMEIWVDDVQTAEQVGELCAMVYPRRSKLVRTHSDSDRSLWEKFGLSRQVSQIYSREVILPSGGRLVFDQAEALMAVDINSGKIGGETNFREMAFRTNMEAAEEIALQLKLRDVGGQVVIDFIEMKDRKHCREVEKTLRAAIKNDRARTDVGRMSRFGLLELVRQRLGSSAISISSEACPCCGGSGLRRNMEWQSMQALKEILRMLRREKPGGHEDSRGGKSGKAALKSAPRMASVVYQASRELASHLLNHKREKLIELEQEFEIRVNIHILPN